MSEHVSRHLRVHGRVQGVGYRNYIEYKAGVLGVSGWVRNRLDGTVEADISGTPDAVEALIECARRGPRKAEVTGVDVSPGEAMHQGFAVHPTE